MEESLQRMQKEFKKNRAAAFVLIGILVLGMIFAILRNMPLSLFFVVLALVYQLVVVVISVGIDVHWLVDEVQRIDWLQELVSLT